MSVFVPLITLINSNDMNFSFGSIIVPSKMSYLGLKLQLNVRMISYSFEIQSQEK